jgi:predicted anti-sigma-YlaC factor YlaD
VRALAERALALDETWSNGTLHDLMITVESQGEQLGGSEDRARKHYARAVENQQGRSPGPHVALATGVVKANQNRVEFERLMNAAIAIDPNAIPSQRVATLITQRRAKMLMDHIDDLFFD